MQFLYRLLWLDILTPHLVASTGETSVSFSKDTFHSQKEGAFHLIFYREVKKKTDKKSYFCCKTIICHMSYAAHVWVAGYLEQSVNGTAGAQWGQLSFHRGLLGGCIHKCCFPSILPVEMSIHLRTVTHQAQIYQNSSREVCQNQPATGPSGLRLSLICTLFSHLERPQKWSHPMSETNNREFTKLNINNRQ